VRDACPTLRNELGDECGQTLVLSALLLVCLMGFAAVLMDGGNYMLQHRKLQGNADAAALAAVKELPNSTSEASSAASSYSGAKNSEDVATISNVTYSNSDTTVKVDVERTVSGNFMGLFGMSAPTLTATATAQVNQITGVQGGLLPIGVLEGGYTLASPNDFHGATSGAGNWGNIAPPYGPPTCPYNPSGASGLKDEIAGTFGGGTDACGPDIGGTIATQTGNTNSMQQGFNLRFGFGANDNDPDWSSISDTWANTVHYDSSIDRYVVDNPNSARIGFIPILTGAGGAMSWPSGNGSMTVTGYIMVFIGKIGTAGEPAYTGNGGDLDIWITPINAVMPEGMSAVTGDSLSTTWDSSGANANAPIVYRLTA
jgi:Flp pilus assembly protein TadG